MQSPQKYVCGPRDQNSPLCICFSFPGQSDHIINALTNSTIVDVDEKIPLLLDGPCNDNIKVPNVHIKRHGSIVSVISDEISFVQRSAEHHHGSYGSSDSFEDRTKTHCHTKKPDDAGTKAAQRKLTIASIVCLLFLIGEFIGKCIFLRTLRHHCFQKLIRYLRKKLPTEVADFTIF